MKNGCLLDHPDVPLFLEVGQGSEGKFRKSEVVRGTSPGAGFHLHMRTAIAAKLILTTCF